MDGVTTRPNDVLVVGGGAMGLAAAWAAAGRGLRVLLLERFEAGHVRGASHGGERIFRFGYTDPVYVRLAVAADEGWRRLEAATGAPLIDRIGCVDHGLLDEVTEIAVACQGEGVAVEWLTRADAHRRWPGHRFDGDVLLQPDAGRARAADALRALGAEAERAGAELRFGAGVIGIDVRGSGVEIRTESGTERAPVAVVAAGAWVVDLLDPLVALPVLTTTREQVAFFRPRGEQAWPSFIHRAPPVHYGLPSPEGLVKIGEHHTGVVTTGDGRSFEIDAAALARVASYAAEWLPGVDPEPTRATTCLYTSTATEHFVLDRVGPLVVAAGFSGHGFKFVPEIGRILAAMAAGEDPPGAPFALTGHSVAAAASTVGSSGHR
jgi:sarcosine oxidase